VTVLSLAISPLWLTSARRVHGLASRQIDTLRELVDAAYGDEVQVVRRGSRRFAIVTRVVLRSGWGRAVNRFPALARIKKPHRPAATETRANPNLITGPDTPSSGTEEDKPATKPSDTPDTKNA